VGLINVEDSDRDAEPLAELRALVETAGADVVAEITQNRAGIDPSYYLGRGKIEEVGQTANALGAGLVIFDNDLSPGQVRNVERYVSCKVIDRSEVIMDIFATRARTKMARLQVELAQLEYEMPRLKRMWTHLDRLDGGGIGTRGPGERQLEVDRRLMGKRIRDLKRDLSQIEARQERQVRSRHDFTTVSLVGYTNAGKSTLMNCLTGKDVFVEDKLFATLDTRTALWELGAGEKALLSDTVGFIRKLPHHLIASFKATLEETRHADLLLHVMDASDPDLNRHHEVVIDVLQEMGCGDKPRLCVLNKLDRVTDVTELNILHSRLPETVEVSALTGENLDGLRDKVVEFIDRGRSDIEVRFPSSDGRLLSYLHTEGQVLDTRYVDETAVLRVRLDRRLIPNVERSADVTVLRPAAAP
jgi:GTP-binding protein HflX